MTMQKGKQLVNFYRSLQNILEKTERQYQWLRAIVWLQVIDYT